MPVQNWQIKTDYVLTSMATVTSVYTRMAYGHGDVEPVRAPLPFPRKGKDCEESAVFKRDEDRQQALAARTAPAQAPVKVVELQIVGKEPAQSARPVREAQPFVPFLAQQIAQEGLPGGATNVAALRRHEAASDAYILASDDGANILGPVRSRELVI